MKTRTVFSFVMVTGLLLAMSACTGREKQMEAELKKNMQQLKTFTAADTLYRTAAAFAESYPKNKLAEPALFYSAQYFKGRNIYARAAQLYEQYIKNYPDSSNMKDVLVDAGNVYDEMRDAKRARELYELFLKKYPDDPMASSIQDALEFAGVPAAEQLERILQKNAKEQDAISGGTPQQP